MADTLTLFDEVQNLIKDIKNIKDVRNKYIYDNSFSMTSWLRYTKTGENLSKVRLEHLVNYLTIIKNNQKS